MLGRPTCMAIPAALAKGAVTSAGCIGNRIYTGLGDDELYAVIPGIDLERVADEVKTIVAGQFDTGGVPPRAAADVRDPNLALGSDNPPGFLADSPQIRRSAWLFHALSPSLGAIRQFL